MDEALKFAKYFSYFATIKHRSNGRHSGINKIFVHSGINKIFVEGSKEPRIKQTVPISRLIGLGYNELSKPL